MKIIDARWTAEINILTIQCGCGRRFNHRADRWKVTCSCGSVGSLSTIRASYVADQDLGDKYADMCNE